MNSPLKIKELLGIPCPWNGMTLKVLPTKASREREFPRGILAQHPKEATCHSSFPRIPSQSSGKKGQIQLEFQEMKGVRDGVWDPEKHLILFFNGEG